jgi:DinB superfamily
MSRDLLGCDLPTLLAHARRNAAVATADFSPLSLHQLNWKSDEAEWSIGQCFDHLILSHRGYLPIVDAVRRGERRTSLWERVPLLPAILGRLLITTLDPDSGRKVKARKAFLPAASDIDGQIVAAFVEQHERLVEQMESTAGLDVERIIITSPVMLLITYSLMDGFRIIVAHEQNHLAQAERVLHSAGFPR